MALFAWTYAPKQEINNRNLPYFFANLHLVASFSHAEHGNNPPLLHTSFFVPPLPNGKRAGPYPQWEKGRSISPTIKGRIHSPNQNRPSPYSLLQRGQSKSLAPKGPVHIPKWK